MCCVHEKCLFFQPCSLRDSYFHEGQWLKFVEPVICKILKKMYKKCQTCYNRNFILTTIENSLNKILIFFSLTGLSTARPYGRGALKKRIKIKVLPQDILIPALQHVRVFKSRPKGSNPADTPVHICSITGPGWFQIQFFKQS